MGFIRALGLCAALFFASFTTGHVDVFAQDAAKCPKIAIDSKYVVEKGTPMTFTVTLAGGDSNVSPTYNWSVSAGTIASGQGTSSIIVETTELEVDTNVTATVEIGGYDPACSSVSSFTASVAEKPAGSRTR